MWPFLRMRNSLNKWPKVALNVRRGGQFSVRLKDVKHDKLKLRVKLFGLEAVVSAHAQ